MTDFPVLGPASLSPAQRELWDSITKGPRGFYCGGPNAKRIPELYNAYLQFPEFGQLILKIADTIRSKQDLTGRMREVMVLTTSIELGMRVEYDFHVPMARDQGIPESVITAIGRRDVPQFDDEGDRIAYEANLQLVRTATLTDDLRGQVIAHIGYPGLMQLMAVTMLYVITAYTTNVAKVEVLDDYSAQPDQLNDFYAGRSKE